MLKINIKLLILTILVILVIFFSFFYDHEQKLIDPISKLMITKCTIEGLLYPSSKVCTTFTKTGSISAIEKYKMNSYNGDLTSYYDNGNLEYIVEYRNDKIWNVKRYVDAKGHNLDWGHLKDGNGWLKCYSIGNLSSEGTIIEGYKNGWWYKYSNGRLYDSIFYKMGISEGQKNIDNLIY